MKQSRWRTASWEVIEKVHAATNGADETEIEREISAAYPFGERRYHPYTVWLACVKDAREMRRRKRSWKAGTW